MARKDIKEVRLMDSVFLENIHYFYAQTDGTYKFPNSVEGDLIKQAKKEIEANLKKQNKCHS